MKNIINEQIRSLVIHWISIGLILFLFLFLESVNMIGLSVKSECQLAQEKYDGDCTESLMRSLEDEENDFSSRNSAIWALGQIGDERSKSVLQKYYTSYNGENESRSAGLSQLELKRALGYFEGNPNITTFFWRFGKGI